MTSVIQRLIRGSSAAGTAAGRPREWRASAGGGRLPLAVSAVAVAAFAMVLAHEMRLAERLRNRIRGTRMMQAEFSDGNFEAIQAVAIHNLRNLVKPTSDMRDVCRTEQWFKNIGREVELNHSLNRLAIGILAGQPSSSSAAFAAVVEYAARYADDQGNLRVMPKDIDHFAVGMVLLELEARTGRSGYRQAAAKLAEALLARQRTARGTIPYRSELPQCEAVDDKGMICSFLVRYGVVADDQRCLELGVRQLSEFLETAIDPVHQQPYHGYDVEKRERFGPATWLRGSGWLAMGLAEVLQWLPPDHEAKPRLLATLERLIDGLEPWQLPEGTWRWDINNPWARIDTSGTAMIGYSILLANRDAGLADRHVAVAEKALAGILRHTHEDGTVGDALLLCAGIGHYPPLFGPTNTAQGPTLALFSLYRQRGQGRPATP